MLNLFHQFLWAFVDVKRVLNLPFDEPTAWLIATVMLLLILASAAGKLLDGNWKGNQVNLLPTEYQCVTAIVGIGLVCIALFIDQRINRNK